jgi:hypothetical protein
MSSVALAPALCFGGELSAFYKSTPPKAGFFSKEVKKYIKRTNSSWKNY